MINKREQIDNFLYVRFIIFLKMQAYSGAGTNCVYNIMIRLQSPLVGTLYRQLENEVLR